MPDGWTRVMEKDHRACPSSRPRRLLRLSVLLSLFVFWLLLTRVSPGPPSPRQIRTRAAAMAPALAARPGPLPQARTAKRFAATPANFVPVNI